MTNLELVFKTCDFYYIFLWLQSFGFLFCFVSRYSNLPLVIEYFLMTKGTQMATFWSIRLGWTRMEGYSAGAWTTGRLMLQLSIE